MLFQNFHYLNTFDEVALVTSNWVPGINLYKVREEGTGCS